MLKFLSISSIFLLLTACGNNGIQKTEDWYLKPENSESLQNDLKTCRNVSIKNQEDFCAAAQSAFRKKSAQKVREGSGKGKREIQNKKAIGE